MYENHFRLNGRPFLTVPDPKFIYWTPGHSDAYAMLQYSFSSGAPITVITGEIGVGKTTLLRALLRDAPREAVIGLISNMIEGRGDFLQWAMLSLGQEIGDDPYVKLFKRFQDFVINTYASGRRVVLIVDEAQNLTMAQLEELRMLSNINADKDELLQLILIGQPELRATLRRPELTQFRQRVTIDYHLSAMSLSEVESYIEHRLSIAGAQWRIFLPQACRLIHASTGGIPRLVNILCDFCLVYGYAASTKVIDEPLVREFLSGARKHGLFEQFIQLPDGPFLAAR